SGESWIEIRWPAEVDSVWGHFHRGCKAVIATASHAVAHNRQLTRPAMQPNHTPGFGRGRSRDDHRWSPPAQIRTSASTHTALMKDGWRRSELEDMGAGLSGAVSIVRRRDEGSPTFCEPADSGLRGADIT